jgi:hypothetical protein
MQSRGSKCWPAQRTGRGGIDGTVHRPTGLRQVAACIAAAAGPVPVSREAAKPRSREVLCSCSTAWRLSYFAPRRQVRLAGRSPMRPCGIRNGRRGLIGCRTLATVSDCKEIIASRDGASILRRISVSGRGRLMPARRYPGRAPRGVARAGRGVRIEGCSQPRGVLGKGVVPHRVVHRAGQVALLDSGSSLPDFDSGVPNDSQNRAATRRRRLG